jgi:hypothetical protein
MTLQLHPPPVKNFRRNPTEITNVSGDRITTGRWAVVCILCQLVQAPFSAALPVAAPATSAADSSAPAAAARPLASYRSPRFRESDQLHQSDRAHLAPASGPAGHPPPSSPRTPGRPRGPGATSGYIGGPRPGRARSAAHRVGAASFATSPALASAPPSPVGARARPGAPAAPATAAEAPGAVVAVPAWCAPAGPGAPSGGTRPGACGHPSHGVISITPPSSNSQKIGHTHPLRPSEVRS